MTRKWDIVNNRSNSNNDLGNEIIYNTEVLKSNIYDYNDVYIFERGGISIIVYNLATEIIFKNCASFINCITKIDGTTTDNDKDLDLIMPMYNLLKYSSNCSDITGNLSFYSEDVATNFNANIASNDNIKFSKYKTRLIENTETDRENGVLINTMISMSLKYLRNFWMNHCVLSTNGSGNTTNNIMFTIKGTK